MPYFNGFSCNIVVDGVNVPVQAVNHTKRGMTAWIIAPTDKPYSIAIDCSGDPAPRHTYRVYVDGRNVENIITPQPFTTISRGACGSGNLDGIPYWKTAELVFSSVQEAAPGSKPPRVENRAKILQNIGKIECRIERNHREIKKMPMKQQYIAPNGVNNPKHDNELNERRPVDAYQAKSLKISHWTGIGGTLGRRNKYPTYFSRNFDGSGDYVTFVFYYASEEMLRARGVLPKIKRQGTPFWKFWGRKSSVKSSASLNDEKAGSEVDSVFSDGGKEKLSILSYDEKSSLLKGRKGSKGWFCF
ncbi:hypothetical protein TWF696_004570 [Orbilia brochopaga]|uniref:DUF7918 domain-containing protein n=1 Tax=Orbilia brochopaga TaxID=3140254 RepID=A0AAV9V6R7_9PEZI